MEVYIEYVILDNVIIDYILLMVTTSICGVNVSKKNKCFSALLGTIFVIFMPLVTNVDILMVAYRLVVAVLMILVLKRYKNFLQYFSLLLVFVTITFLFGGLLIATLSIFDIVYTTSGLIFLNFEIPISIFILPIFVYALVVIRVAKFLINRWKINKYMYEITIVSHGNSYILKAFLDTGNSLYDIDGRPVIVMELKTFINMYPDYPIHKLLLNELGSSILNNEHYINVSTVNTLEKLLAFDVEKVVINKLNEKKEYTDVCIAVSRKNFDDYNIILHRNFC